jgi:hypothetical protein
MLAANWTPAANARLVGINFDASNTVPSNDLHMLVQTMGSTYTVLPNPCCQIYISPTNPFSASTKYDPNPFVPPNTPNLAFDVDFTNPPSPVPANTVQHFGFLFQTDATSVQIPTLYWTFNGVQNSINIPILAAGINFMGGPPPGVELKVQAQAANPINPNPPQVGVNNMAFLARQHMLPLQQMLPYRCPGSDRQYRISCSTRVTLKHSIRLSRSKITGCSWNIRSIQPTTPVLC